MIKVFIAISAVVHPGWIVSRHETGPTGSTDRTLAERMGEGDAGIHQLVQGWSPDPLVTQCLDRVKSLLIGAVPQDIGLSHD